MLAVMQCRDMKLDKTQRSFVPLRNDLKLPHVYRRMSTHVLGIVLLLVLVLLVLRFRRLLLRRGLLLVHLLGGRVILLLLGGCLGVGPK